MFVYTDICQRAVSEKAGFSSVGKLARTAFLIAQSLEVESSLGLYIQAGYPSERTKRIYGKCAH